MEDDDGEGMAVGPLSIVTATSEYTGTVANVCFKGTKNGKQTVNVEVELKRGEADSYLGIVTRAWQERFLTEMEFGYVNIGQATIYESTANVIKPQTKIQDPVETYAKLSHANPPPTAALWLNVELVNSVLAGARAKAADEKYKALQTEASAQNITLSDTCFAALLGKTTGVLSKALGRCKSEPTAGDGKLVMVIDDKVASYRADLTSLAADIKRIELEKEAVRTRAPCIASSTHCPHTRPALPPVRIALPGRQPMNAYSATHAPLVV